MSNHTHQQRALESAHLIGGIESQTKDKDGFFVPPMYRMMDEDKWLSLANERRKQLSEEFVRDFNREVKSKARKAVSKKAAAYTTKYAIAWAKQSGYSIIASESSHLEYRQSSSGERKAVSIRRDTLIGSDVVAQGPDGLVLVQAAGKGERAAHYSRFLNRGGRDACIKISAQFFYVEFVRESETPVVVEQWA